MTAPDRSPAPDAPQADHPHTDPGDGRQQCETCGKWVWLVTHSCKGVRVAPQADGEDRVHAAIDAAIEASSLGTPEAKALRATVSDETAARIVALSKEIAGDAPQADGLSEAAMRRAICFLRDNRTPEGTAELAATALSLLDRLAARDRDDEGEVVRAFVQHIATDCAYNGAEGWGQRFYDECLNTWLSERADEYVALTYGPTS